jgi:hypothetical protein
MTANSLCRGAWVLSVALVVLASCKDEPADQPAVDPIDDPWVDAIDTGEDESIVAAGPEAVVDTEGAAPTLDEADELPQPEPAEVAAAEPSTDAVEQTGASNHAPAPTKPTKAPAVPEQPAAEAPVDPPAPAAEPTPEPSPTPSVEPSKPVSPPPVTIADFDGSYRYAGGSSQREDLEAAIEYTVSHLSRAIQGIARRRITDTNPVDSSVSITVVKDKVTTSFASGFQVTCVIDGPAVRTKGIDGSRLDVRARMKGTKLVQHMQGRDGARTVVYVLSSDRKKLTVHHKITASRLPEPLTYRLSYSRK